MADKICPKCQGEVFDNEGEQDQGCDGGYACPSCGWTGDEPLKKDSHDHIIEAAKKGGGGC